MKDRKTIVLILLFSAAICCFPAAVYSETVTGTVYDGSNNTALEGVTVSAENALQTAIASTATNASGTFTLESDNITAGDLTISFIISGYVTARGSFTITSGTNAIDQILLAPDSSESGTITGTLIDATTTDTSVVGATITLYTGINHTDVTYVTTYTTTTAADGTFELTGVEAGSYTLLAVQSGFADSFVNVVSVGGQTTTYEHSISPVAAEGEIRIVLTWGENPRDLDSHLYTPEIDGTSHHLYYANRSSYSVDASPNISLDRDDVTSYGPETITIAVSFEGEYEYKIYHYSGTGTLATSGATVKVYDSTGLLFTVNVPASLTDPLWWDVFRYNGETGSFSSPTGQSLYGGGSGSSGMPTKYIDDKDDNSCFITALTGGLF